MIRVISDSTCDLSREILEQFKIGIIPLHVHLGDRSCRDGVDITPTEIFQWSDANQATPKTSAPSLEEVMEIYKTILDAGDEMIVFTISASMSSSNNVCMLAAQELDAEDRITVIDSANLSSGVGLLVLEAADLAAKGMSRAEILKQIEHLRPLVRASFVIDTLVYLHRGGRCSGLAALMGSALKLHPRIVVQDGKMHSDKKYRGSIDKVVLAYSKDLEEALLKARPNRVFITHSMQSKEAVESVRRYLQALGYFKNVYVTDAGGVVSSHCGPGTLGVLFIAGE